MALLRTILWISYLFGYLLTMLPKYFKAKRLKKQGRDDELWNLLDYEVDHWASRLLYHVGVKVEVGGRENLPQKGEVVVYAVNHQSFLDIPIVLSNLDKPHGLMSKSSIDKVPLLRGWMRMLGCVYVDRHDMRSSVEALRTAEATVRAGKSFIIFPEGTRSKDGSLGEFKAGAVRIAYKAKARVIPVAIDGSLHGLEANGFRLKKCTVRMTILPGIETAQLSRPEQKELPARIETAVRQVLEQTQSSESA